MLSEHNEIKEEFFTIAKKKSHSAVEGIWAWRVKNSPLTLHHYSSSTSSSGEQKYSTKQIWPSSLRTRYCSDRNPRESVRTDTLQDRASAFVDGFNRDILYLQTKPKNLVNRGSKICHVNISKAVAA